MGTVKTARFLKDMPEGVRAFVIAKIGSVRRGSCSAPIQDNNLGALHGRYRGRPGYIFRLMPATSTFHLPSTL